MIRARVASAGGSRCEAELAGGGRLAGLSFEARIGEDLTLAVRPERVRFCNGDVRPLLRGVVEDVIYRGVVIRYTVRVSGVDRPLQVERPNLGRDREMDPGEEVSMVWEAADVSVVGEGDG
jgi:ABC-type Fe3+/spermidine/putrescine transport system ATPase subunit